MSQKRKFVSESVKHIFTENEMKELHTSLALKTAELRDDEEAKKAITQQLSSKITELKTHLQLLASKLNSGYEFKIMDCEVIFDFNTNVKTIVHPETGEIITSAQIKEHEKQQELGFSE